MSDKTGRPPKPANERAESYIHIRIPTAEKAKAVRDAQIAGKTLAQHVRDRLK